MSPVIDLSIRQLRAYNAGDLAAFCACFHEQVRVLDEAGTLTCGGLAAFRQRYADLWASFTEVRAEVIARVSLGRTVVELENYQRRSTQSGQLESGQVLIRYTEQDGQFAIVQCFRP